MDEALKKSGEYPNIALTPGTNRHAATGEAVEIPASARVDGGTCKPAQDGTCKNCGETVARAWATVKLFGTPERAAQTLHELCGGCCGLPEQVRGDYDALLEWLRCEA